MLLTHFLPSLPFLSLLSPLPQAFPLHPRSSVHRLLKCHPQLLELWWRRTATGTYATHTGVVLRTSRSETERGWIYTGGVAFTRAAYLESCPSNNVVNQALPSPAFKKKRTEEKSAFVGGKICPIGELACPLKTGLSCMNVKDNLNSCGGCIGGAGVDCSDLQGVDEVSCVKGKCVAHSCIRGWNLSYDEECVKG